MHSRVRADSGAVWPGTAVELASSWPDSSVDSAGSVGESVNHRSLQCLSFVMSELPTLHGVT